jgi:GNAT superfamily N-acetyltransferase
MSIEILPVTTPKNLHDFIHLPFILHKNDRLWVPPLLTDERQFFSARKNPAFKKNDTILLLAMKEKKPVGRIMGIVNRERNRLFHEQNARFGFLESIEDVEAVRALLSSVEAWARGLGMVKLVGPMSFTDQEPEAFLIEGFEYEPTLSTIYNFEYLPRLVEECGYTKEIDYVCYVLDITRPIPEFYQKITDKIMARGEFTFRNYTKRKELKPYVKPVLELLSEAYIDLYGFVPLTPEEIEALGRKYLPVLDPRLVKVGLKDDQVIGFLIGMPNMNAGFRKAKGRLFPFGIFHLLRESKRSRQLDLLLGGVRKEYRGIGLDALGMKWMIQTAKEMGFTTIDSHNELENNLAVRGEMERLGGKLCKRRRIYQKAL